MLKTEVLDRKLSCYIEHTYILYKQYHLIMKGIILRYIELFEYIISIDYHT